MRAAAAPTGAVFDVDTADVQNLWDGLTSFREKEKVWEVRIPPLPDVPDLLVEDWTAA
mgnify:CR=1 FL=1